MDKNSRKMGIGDAQNQMQEKGDLKKVCNASIDSVLANEMLVAIFKFLPAADRMRLELVSKKWNRLSRKWAWINYSIVSVKQFPGFDKWENDCSRFNSLFLRCGKYVKELDFSLYMQSHITSDYICNWLPLLPNLRHLNLDEFSLSTAALTLIANTFPCLISLTFMCSTSDNFGGVTSVLDKCKRLEILEIYDGGNLSDDLYHFVVLPPALKCVCFADFCDYGSFFLQLVSQGIQLQSLELGAPFDSDISSFCAINLDRFNYLTLQVDSIVLNHFVRLIRNLSHLQALELYIRGETEEVWTDEKVLDLKHLRLTLSFGLTVRYEKLALLANLPRLCSVSINSISHASHSFPIFALFEKLTLSGRLQYFDTSEVLFPEQICQALIRCKDLTGIFCAQTKLRKKQWIDLLLVTLEKIHQGEKLPATADDERILHTNYGNDINIDLPHHPWVRFYKNCEQFPSSRVQEHIRLGGVSNKPNC